MLVVETVAKIRRAFFVHGKSIKAICRDLRVSRKVVRKVVRSEETEFHYEREEQPLPRIGPWQEELDGLLKANEGKASRERLTLIRIFEDLRGRGYAGGYDAVRRYARTWQRDRAYNRRFAQMCSHYLIDPVACTPASGWEKGQVENQVGLVRERFFTPRLRVKSFDELNTWLVEQCISYARAHPHPEVRDRTIWEQFEGERPNLVPYAGRFDGFHAVTASVSKTCLVRFDNNRYSVSAHAIGRPVEIRAYADRIELRQDGRPVGEHARCFGRDQTVFNPWHYVPVLARKPGALRNGAPFKDWVLPTGLDRIRRKLAGSADGDRQMVGILTAVLSDGLPAVDAACQEALREGVHSADVVINILARRREPPPAAPIMTPAALELRHAPIADCTRYDTLRRAT
jgi:hypothetical protein